MHESGSLAVGDRSVRRLGGSASPENASPARTDGKQIAGGANIRRRNRSEVDNAFHPSLYEEDVQFRQSHPRPREIGDL